MRFLPFLFVALLTACQHTPPPALAERPAVGSPAWFERVEQQFPTSDGYGHGPDHGSQEWCDVVFFRIMGQRSEQAVPCDSDWLMWVDQQLAEPAPLQKK